MRERRRERQELVAETARRQGGVLSRRQVYALGITRSETRAEVRAARWARLGSQSLQVGPADASTPWWRAVFEVGPTAVLDGISALQAAGLTTITSDAVHVAVPKSAEYRHCRGVQVHETRRYREQDIVKTGIPRTTRPQQQCTLLSGLEAMRRRPCSSSHPSSNGWSRCGTSPPRSP